jgi:hypothetical protein
MLWVMWYMLHVRSRARSGGIVFPPVVSAHVLFLVCIVVVLFLRLSALHLLWLFPLCFAVGFIILAFPIVQKVVFGIVTLLAYPIER